MTEDRPHLKVAIHIFKVLVCCEAIAVIGFQVRNLTYSRKADIQYMSEMRLKLPLGLSLSS